MMMTEKQMKAQAQARRAAKRRKAIRNRMILAGIIVTLAALLVAGIALNIKKANAAYEAEEIVYTPTHSGVFVEYYHEVKLGESLGTIAVNYIQQYNSSETVDDVVNRIINYNGLDRKEATYHLQAGTRIVVPLWIAEDRNPYHTTTEESQN
jgi:hypothetical protein